MTKFRGFAFGLVLGLSIAIAGVGFAQNASQSGAEKKTGACCCMASGCGGDSCAMKDGAKTTGAAAKHECGDSCPMMKDGAKSNGVAKSEKHECCCCCGDSCEMKQTKDMKTTPQ